ncbi:MAG TPA: RDD family protein [Stellaceae bacterium]|nr:RDD family protein [Stellaceae bacterium]
MTMATAVRPPKVKEKRSARRDLMTPEGVILPVELAGRGGRAGAFLIDLVIWLGSVIGIYLGIDFGFKHGADDVVLEIAEFIVFIIRQSYFIFFEIVWQGRTPGKRLLGLRVVDRRGGPLLPASVIVRNLARDLELFLPLRFLVVDLIFWSPWWAVLNGACLLGFLLLPFFNRGRLRLGDFVAGTMVIKVRPVKLAQDLIEAQQQFRFSDKQLRAYGAFELQVLEDALRRSPSSDTEALYRDVAAVICRRIDFPSAVAAKDAERFLRDFYAAQRGFLEREQLFGKPRLDKHHAG